MTNPKGRSGLGLGHLGQEIPEEVPKDPERSRASKRANRRGKGGEREVVKLWKPYYPWAARSPHSGGWRPSGGSVSPMPGDIVGIGNWICEVKFDQRVVAGGLRTWPGQTFFKATLRKLTQETKLAGTRYEPCLFARAARQDWQVWVRAWWFSAQLGSNHRTQPKLEMYARDEWLALPIDEFFALDQGHWIGRSKGER